ncbi:MAG: hypothetical protein J7559_20740 [Cohnella sp.]|nr:hypothetical protein [Cohnella sp.]
MNRRKQWTRVLFAALAAVLAFGVLSVSAFAAGTADKPKVVKLASGNNHALAVLDNGTVMAWGDNKYGQLGNGSNDNTNPTPSLVQGLTDVIDVAGGMGHSLALKKDGTVWAWGANHDGQLGNGTKSKMSADFATVVEDHNSSVPVQVTGLDHVKAITAGWSSSFALKEDGTVWAWGSNGWGALGLGDNTLADQLTPKQVVGLTDVSSIYSGWNHVHAIQKDGTSWSWGYNSSATAGDGTQTIVDETTHLPIEDNEKRSPVAVSGNHRFTMLAPKHNAGCYAVEADGTLWYWGVVVESETARHYEKTPILVTDIKDVQAIYPTVDALYVVKKDGTVWAESGGYDKFIKMDIPKVKSISVGGWSHAQAIAEDGSVYAWGYNSYGQLGEPSRKFVGKAKPIQLAAFYVPEKEVVPVVVPTVYANGKAAAAKLDVSKGYPMLSLADAMKLIGGKSSEDKKKKLYTLTRGKTKLEISAGSTSAKLNGKSVKLKQAPTIMGNQLWVPTAVLESLGAKTKWDAAAQRLDITVK